MGKKRSPGGAQRAQRAHAVPIGWDNGTRWDPGGDPRMGRGWGGGNPRQGGFSRAPTFAAPGAAAPPPHAPPHPRGCGAGSRTQRRSRCRSRARCAVRGAVTPQRLRTAVMGQRRNGDPEPETPSRCPPPTSSPSPLPPPIYAPLLRAHPHPPPRCPPRSHPRAVPPAPFGTCGADPGPGAVPQWRMPPPAPFSRLMSPRRGGNGTARPRGGPEPQGMGRTAPPRWDGGALWGGGGGRHTWGCDGEGAVG